MERGVQSADGGGWLQGSCPLAVLPKSQRNQSFFFVGLASQSEWEAASGSLDWLPEFLQDILIFNFSGKSDACYKWVHSVVTRYATQ